jgi:hypothetical protein
VNRRIGAKVNWCYSAFPKGGSTGQSHLNSQDLEQILFIPTSLEPFGVAANLFRSFLLEQVQCDVSQECKILGPMALSDATDVLGKGNIL